MVGSRQTFGEKLCPKHRVYGEAIVAAPFDSWVELREHVMEQEADAP
ncbi:MAG TPA: hypothetical protein VFN67_16425 [Polyangiales bacterium]|jgi:hypothetical protein|nr:hypothetical protein [Polyangiales bacterium]